MAPKNPNSNSDRAFKQGAPGGRCMPSESSGNVFANMCIKCGSTHGTMTVSTVVAGDKLAGGRMVCSGCATDRNW